MPSLQDASCVMLSIFCASLIHSPVYSPSPHASPCLNAKRPNQHAVFPQVMQVEKTLKVQISKDR